VKLNPRLEQLIGDVHAGRTALTADVKSEIERLAHDDLRRLRDEVQAWSTRLEQRCKARQRLFVSIRQEGAAILEGARRSFSELDRIEAEGRAELRHLDGRYRHDCQATTAELERDLMSLDRGIAKLERDTGALQNAVESIIEKAE